MKCGRCRNEIKKGEYFLNGMDIDLSWLKSPGVPKVYCLKCGAYLADILDAWRMNRKMEEKSKPLNTGENRGLRLGFQ